MADTKPDRWFDGSALCTARREAGMSQQMVARKARISPTHMSQIESGIRQPSPPVAARLAKAVGRELAGLTATERAAS